MNPRPSLEHFQQSNMIALILIALVLSLPMLLLGLALSILLGALFPALSPFRWLYSKLTGTPEENPSGFDARQFTQLLTGGLLLLGALALYGGAFTLALVLSGTVTVLALLHLTTGFCLGCQLFYRLKLLQHRQTHHQ